MFRRRTFVEGRRAINIFLLVLIILLLFSLIFSDKIERLLKLKPDIVYSNYTQVHFIDVGQGDAIAVSLSNGKVMLIDSGTKEYEKKIDYYLDNIVLKNHKVIDYLVLTHPDVDHSGNIKHIMDKYKIGEFFRPNIYELYENCTPYCENITYRQIIQTASAKNIPTKFHSDCEILDGNVKISFLTVLEYLDLNNIETNDISPMIIINDCEQKILLAGDISSEIENKFMQKYSYEYLDIDVLKLSHHGSKYSNSFEFLEVTSPKYVVASCGVNTYGHPANETIARLLEYDKINNTNLYSNFLTTKDDGNIIYSLEKDIKVQTIKNIDDYNFAHYYIYVIISIGFITFVIVKPYVIALKKDYRFYKQNRDYDRLKEKEALQKSREN